MCILNNTYYVYKIFIIYKNVYVVVFENLKWTETDIFHFSFVLQYQF